MMSSCYSNFMTDEEKRIKRNAYMREYYQRNREKIIERTTDYYYRRMEEQPELVRELNRKRSAKWREENPERAREMANRGRRAARVRAVEYVNGLKENVPCADCGQTLPPVCMDFDHIRGDKKHSIARMVGQNFSIETIQEEIDKCELVCANCHRMRTYSRLRELGGITTYVAND